MPQPPPTTASASTFIYYLEGRKVSKDVFQLQAKIINLIKKVSKPNNNNDAKKLLRKEMNKYNPNHVINLNNIRTIAKRLERNFINELNQSMQGGRTLQSKAARNYMNQSFVPHSPSLPTSHWLGVEFV
jgi:hypothetical protein